MAGERPNAEEWFKMEGPKVLVVGFVAVEFIILEEFLDQFRNRNLGVSWHDPALFCRRHAIRQPVGGLAFSQAMLDRLVHHGHVLKCGPRSWRTKTDLPSQEPEA